MTMKIIDIINRAAADGKARFTFELLPPLKGEGTAGVFEAIDTLAPLDPAYINVTFHREDTRYTERPEAEFINSSFGIPPVMSVNMPVPIFPLTGLGITARWDISEMFSWQAAVFDGYQKPFEDNPHNLNWQIRKEDGVFAATELHINTRMNNLDGLYKVGGFYHSGFKEPGEESQAMEYVFRNNYGFYVLLDQTVLNNEADNRKIGLFAQLAFCPKSKNDHAYYLGAGANYYGLFSKEGNDVLGLAVAHVDLHRTSHKHETTLELYYKWQFNDNFALQPDLQYVINPSGTGEALDNALACLLRVHINF